MTSADRRSGAVVVAVDVGGTTIKSGVAGSDGVHRVRRTPTGRERGPDAVVEEILGTVDHLIADTTNAGDDVVGIAVAVPGIVDDDRGVAVYSETLDWHDVALASLLADRCGVPTRLTHDVRAGGHAEVLAGAAIGATDALFIPIGTGIAAAVIAGGTMIAGPSAQAGEIGQLLVPTPPTGRRADDPAEQTLEVVASSYAIGERYHRAGGDRIDAAEVLTRAIAGEALAAAVAAESIAVLGDVFATAIAATDPEVVVLGGGLASAGRALVDPMEARLAARLPWRQLPRLTTARFGHNAGLIGCALLAWREAALPFDDLLRALQSTTGDELR